MILPVYVNSKGNSLDMAYLCNLAHNAVNEHRAFEELPSLVIDIKRVQNIRDHFEHGAKLDGFRSDYAQLGYIVDVEEGMPRQEFIRRCFDQLGRFEKDLLNPEFSIEAIYARLEQSKISLYHFLYS
jgi:hypothetical protein